MDIKDITKRQLETLVLVRCLEEFITDEHENLANLSEVIWTFEESLSTEEYRQLVGDICKLTEQGYLVSDATEEHIKMNKIPEVKSITPKGNSVLNDWEQKLKENNAAKKEENITVINNYTLLGSLTINSSLLSGTASVFHILKDIIGGILHEK